jgi:RimJ/RimL family protein N-acetyltransferase
MSQPKSASHALAQTRSLTRRNDNRQIVLGLPRYEYTTYIGTMEGFETAKLSAERLRENHLADLVALHLDPHVMRYLGGVRSPEVTRAYLASNLEHWDRFGFGLWVLRTRDGKFVGRAGIRHLVVEGVPEVEVAFTFQRVLWGKGLATEITEALVNFGFTKWHLPSMVGVVEAQNIASRRVLEKCGFALERRVIHQGEDCAVFRRWKARGLM